MQEHAKFPAIRFAGFPDAWEQRKLGEFLEEYYEKAPKDGSFEHVSLTKEGVIPKTKRYDRDSLVTTESKLYRVTHLDDICYNPANLKFGVICRNTYGDAIFSPIYITFRTSPGCVPGFIERYIVREQFVNHALLYQQGTVYERMAVSPEDLLSLDIHIPSSFSEQVQISQLFSHLDHLITLHQRKYDKLVNTKKSMLEKMFPRDGASVPEIRFAGFSDAWEQRKLGELAERTYGGGTPATSNESFWNGDIPWIQSSDIADGKLFGVVPRKYITQEGLSKSATQLVPGDSIAIITRVGVGKLAFMPFSYTTSQDFLSLSKLKVDAQFAVYALYKKLQSELNSVQGTSIKGITKDELLAKEIMVPDPPEQAAIGELLYSLDHLITLHQRELERLQNIKKSCLEKMFV